MKETLLLIGLLCLTLPASILAETKMLSLGVIVPLTGDYANFGQAGRTGIEMAMTRVPQPSLKITYEDNQYGPSAAVAAFYKLLNLDKVDVMINLGSAPSAAILPLADKRKVPLFVWTASSKLSTGHPQAIRLMSSGSEQGKVIGAEVVARGFSKIAYFSAQGEFFQAVHDGFIENVSPDKIVDSYEIPLDSKDFRPELMKAARHGATELGVCLSTGQVSTFIRQAFEILPKARLFGCHATAAPDVARTLKDTNQSLWFVEGLLNPEFVKEFTSRNPDTSGIWVAGAFHDVIQLLSSKMTSDPTSSVDMKDFYGKCITASAFNRACVIAKDNDVFLDVKLGVTIIRDGNFIREGVPS